MIETLMSVTDASRGRAKIGSVARKFQAWRDKVAHGKELLEKHITANDAKMAEMARENEGIRKEVVEADRWIAGFDRMMDGGK